MLLSDTEGLADDTIALALLAYARELVQCENEEAEDNLRLCWPHFSALWDERTHNEARTNQR